MKKAKSLSIFSLVLALAFFLLSISSINEARAEAKTLKIGMITSITGPMAPAFKSMIDSVKPTQDLLNQKGGITVNGQKYLLEIVAEDDQSSPANAVSAANRLIQAGVKYLVSPMFLAANIAIARTCEDAKVIRVVSMSSDPVQFGPENPYSFNALQTVYGINPVYDYFVKSYPNAKRIAIISPDDPGITYPKEFVSKVVLEKGLEEVFNERYKIGTQDFYPLLTKALQNKPDAIDLVTSIVPWAAGIISQARELGFAGPIFAPCPVGDINILKKIVKPEYANGFFHGAPDVLSEKMLPIVRELRPMVEKSTNADLLMDNVLLLAAIQPMLQGIKKAQTFDTAQVAVAMESLTTVETPWGKAKWAGKDLGFIDHMIKLENVPLSRIVNGKVEFEFLK